MSPQVWVFDDGGRAAAGYRGDTGDCVVRSIAIATELGYTTVYDALAAAIEQWTRNARTKAARRHAARNSCSPHDGVDPEVFKPYLAELGWIWTPMMSIGSGTTVHLRPDELPAGRMVVRCSGHLTAVVDGVVHDTHDPTRDGTRAVYGIWTKGGRT